MGAMAIWAFQRKPEKQVEEPKRELASDISLMTSTHKLIKLFARLHKSSTRRTRYDQLTKKQRALLEGFLHYCPLMDKEKAAFAAGVLRRAMIRRSTIGLKHGYLESWEKKLLKQRKEEK